VRSYMGGFGNLKKCQESPSTCQPSFSVYRQNYQRTRPTGPTSNRIRCIIRSDRFCETDLSVCFYCCNFSRFRTNKAIINPKRRQNVHFVARTTRSIVFVEIRIPRVTDVWQYPINVQLMAPPYTKGFFRRFRSLADRIGRVGMSREHGIKINKTTDRKRKTLSLKMFWKMCRDVHGFVWLLWQKYNIDNIIEIQYLLFEIAACVVFVLLILLT